MLVANRTEMIKNHTNVHEWHYIGYKDNLADYISRGIDVAIFCGNQNCEPF